ncbi:Urea-proton symporter DUR3 [Coccomyxa sp. Obi]|nr:Urea-proton symporter DUR3 [Coccomyxa sp. Obi]
MAEAAAPAPVVNLFGLTQYDGLTTFFGDQSFDYNGYVLPEYSGWIVVILFGAIFAFLAVFLVWVDVKFAGAIYNSEQFNTAGRSIGTGLLAVDIVSHWTWASILLTSVSYGYFYGITGSYWFAVNDAAIIVLFAVIALEIKYKAPKAHTLLELVYVRWGRWAHMIFFFFAVVTNLLVSMSMLQGCVSAVNALTGVNLYAMSFLIPIGVVFYAAIGGLKATFTTSYMHTVIVYIVCVFFLFKVFVPGNLLNGIDDIYYRLQVMSENLPVPDQKDGSYLTMFSLGGFEFSIIFFFSALSQMLVDQAYWQSAIAAKATCAVKGYFLGGFLFLGIVFALPVALGSAALALDLPLSTDEALGGLVMPAAAYVLIGKSGAVLVIVICFMAVTSSGASEMVAVSSLFTFDVYRRYIKPQATGGQLVVVSRVGVCVWAIVMGAAMCIAQAAGINVNWLITIIGVFVGGAVPPLAALLTWRGCTAPAAMLGAVLGCLSGIIGWLVTAQTMSGEITIASTGLNPPLLAGNIISNGVSAIILVIVSYSFPDKVPFQWEAFKERITTSEAVVKKAGAIDASAVESDEEQAAVARLRKPTIIAVIIIFSLACIVWPLLTLPAGVFSLGYFRFYVIMAFIFLILASAIGIFLPIWEARDLFAKVLTGNTFKELIEKSFHGSRHGSTKNGSVAKDDTARTATGDPKIAADPIKSQL